ncbi:hypothetical protein [Natronobiforma cellulositropha]|uniref:hypothetical protein n=1 Tax=Natronobiforma cellulositropha TaxID=1679076 RepID=UPI0021D5CB91|nr:hypothetical protein [Natronobiforma cellulositropha]
MADGRGLVSFDLESGSICVSDELEGQGLEIGVSGDSEVQSALTELFVFPVDDAVTIQTSMLRIESHADTCLRDETGTHIAEFSTVEQSFPPGTYFLEVTGPLKVYVRIVDTGIRARYPHHETPGRPLEVEFDGQAQVTIGGRSFHTRPRTTMTVPDEPAALAEALPYLASSIKEFSCERSWPSLRGHPPLLERGERLEIPAELERPETGVELAVPTTYADLYRIAPLAFYLGASVVDGEAPELRLENGYTEPLGTGRALEERVARLLGRCLVLDSLTRVGGYYTYRRHEYETTASRLPFYPPNLYGRSLSEQLLEYLEVPFDELRPSLPRWPSTVVVRPGADDCTVLPYALNSLSRICVSTAATQAGEVETPRASPSAFVAYTGTPPEGANTVTRASFANGLERCATPETEARVSYVMETGERTATLTETLERQVLTAREYPEITRCEAPTRAELRAALRAETVLCWCDLGTTARGIVCRDGVLELEALDDVGAAMVHLRAGEDLDVARAVVDGGALACVVTERQVPVEHAAFLGGYVSSGRSLVDSVELADLSAATPLRFVGDATQVAVRCDGGINPVWMEVDSVGPDSHRLTVRSQLTDIHRLGSTSKVFDENVDGAFQLTGVTADQPLECSTETVVEYLEDDHFVVRLNGETYHGGREATPSFVRESARRARERLQ